MPGSHGRNARELQAPLPGGPGEPGLDGPSLPADRELGRLRAAGTGTPDPQSVPVRPWAAIGAALRLSLRVVGPLVAEASVGGLVAIDRDRFTWGSEVAFETPPVVGRATLGLSIVVP